MHYLTRTGYVLRIRYHRCRIWRCRQKGIKLMRRTGELVSPRLMELNSLVTRHGCILHRLETKVG